MPAETSLKETCGRPLPRHRPKLASSQSTEREMVGTWSLNPCHSHSSDLPAGRGGDVGLGTLSPGTPVPLYSCPPTHPGPVHLPPGGVPLNFPHEGFSYLSGYDTHEHFFPQAVFPSLHYVKQGGREGGEVESPPGTKSLIKYDTAKTV